MLGAPPSQFHLRCCSQAVSDHAIPTSGNSFSSSSSCSSSHWLHCSPIRFRFRAVKSFLISCKSSRGSSSGVGRSGNASDNGDDHDYLPASLLLPETLAHHRMRRQGFLDDMTWKSYSKLFPSAIQGWGSTGPDPGTTGVGFSFLRRFQNPTIFLKISCNGDFLLPIVVGEFAVEKLMDALPGENDGGCPDLFQVVKNIVGKLGHEVQMVRINKRVVNTYFSRLYIGKPGENDVLSVDARPSDAINVANSCKAQIFVSKEIVLSDAIKISYGMGRPRDSGPMYDVSLDSASDGPDFLAEELVLVKNLNLAIEEERYNDAAMLRDKLMKLRESRPGP